MSNSAITARVSVMELLSRLYDEGLKGKGISLSGGVVELSYSSVGDIIEDCMEYIYGKEGEETMHADQEGQTITKTDNPSETEQAMLSLASSEASALALAQRLQDRLGAVLRPDDPHESVDKLAEPTYQTKLALEVEHLRCIGPDATQNVLDNIIRRLEL